MSLSPSRPPFPWCLRLGRLFLIGTFVVGCASQPQESGKAADSVATTKEPAAPNVPVTPAQALQPSAESTPGVAPQGAGIKKEEASGRSESLAPAAKTERTRGASARPAAASAPLPMRKSGSARASETAPSRLTLDEPEAQPAYAEPPELTQALAQFDAQWETLSTSRACDDACRALESMRRSAQKICDLVLDGDPRAHCTTARARLEQATRDLSARCSTCR